MPPAANIVDRSRAILSSHDGALRRAIIGACVVLAIAVLLEVFLFNVNFFITRGYEEVDLSDQLGLVQDQQGYYRLTEHNQSMEFHDLNTDIVDEIERAGRYFEEHYNEEINIEQYAVSRNMSTSWFNRSFRSAMGTSPMRFILDVRIRNAQVLLETTDYSISVIAGLVGYDNPLYFSRLFRKAKGLSPAKYRKTFREQFIAGVPEG